MEPWVTPYMRVPTIPHYLKTPLTCLLLSLHSLALILDRGHCVFGGLRIKSFRCGSAGCISLQCPWSALQPCMKPLGWESGQTISVSWPGTTTGSPDEIVKMAREREICASLFRLLPTQPDSTSIQFGWRPARWKWCSIILLQFYYSDYTV